MEWDIAVEAGENNLRSLRQLATRVTSEVALGVDKGYALKFIQGLGPSVAASPLRPSRVPHVRPAFVALDVGQAWQRDVKVEPPERGRNLLKQLWHRVCRQPVNNASGNANETGRPNNSNAALLSLPCERSYNPFELDPEPMLSALCPLEVADVSKRFGIKHRASIVTGTRESMNELFAKKHPEIHPSFSLSKMRSMKLKLFRLVYAHADLLDPAPMACAWIYFERLVMMGLVTKTNRRAVLGACVILAFKFNQDQRFDDRSSKLTHTVLPDILDRQVYEKDILRIEFDVFASLGFDLWVSNEQAEPHMLHYHHLFHHSEAKRDGSAESPPQTLGPNI